MIPQARKEGVLVTEETLGKQIAAARKRHHLSQSQLAEKMQVAKYTIQRWEHDMAIPHIYAQGWLIRNLGVNEEAFAHAERQRKNSQSVLSEEIETSPEEGDEVMEQVKVYEGKRELVEVMPGAWTRRPSVTVNGETLPYFWHDAYGQVRDPERELLYEWGYTGEGPRNLALSILADYFGEQHDPHVRGKEYKAVRYHLRFKDDFIVWLPSGDTDEWQITSIEITQWLESQKDKEEKNEYFQE